MNDEHPMENEQQEDWKSDYTAFEMWPYARVFQHDPTPKTWVDFTESYFRAAKALIDSVIAGALFEDVEGIAAVFLFRHYLELKLKQMILAGRWIRPDGTNASRGEVEAVRNIHGLEQLWGSVLADVKPKIARDWEKFDVHYVERCVQEFAQVDPKGFTLRYSGQGAEKLSINFEALRAGMDHVRQVLEAIAVYLSETYGQNAEYEAILRDEVGSLDWLA